MDQYPIKISSINSKNYRFYKCSKLEVFPIFAFAPCSFLLTSPVLTKFFACRTPSSTWTSSPIPTATSSTTSRSASAASGPSGSRRGWKSWQSFWRRSEILRPARTRTTASCYSSEARRRCPCFCRPCRPPDTTISCWTRSKGSGALKPTWKRYLLNANTFMSFVSPEEFTVYCNDFGKR